LDRSESVFAEHLRQLEEDHRRLETERARLLQLNEDLQRARLAREKADNEDACRAKQKVQQRTEQLNERQSAVEQLHAEVTRIHGETLEMRLLTEQLWAKLSGKSTPAETTKTMAVLRDRLDDHYRLTHQAIEKKLQKTRDLAGRLNTHQEQLMSQRKKLQQWVNRRQKELEEQAIALGAREQQFEQQRWAYLDQQEQWKEERRQFQQQIRELTLQDQQNRR